MNGAFGFPEVGKFIVDIFSAIIGVPFEYYRLVLGFHFDGEVDEKSRTFRLLLRKAYPGNTCKIIDN